MRRKTHTLILMFAATVLWSAGCGLVEGSGGAGATLTSEREQVGDVALGAVLGEYLLVGRAEFVDHDERLELPRVPTERAQGLLEAALDRPGVADRMSWAVGSPGGDDGTIREQLDEQLARGRLELYALTSTAALAADGVAGWPVRLGSLPAVPSPLETLRAAGGRLVVASAAVTVSVATGVAAAVGAVLALWPSRAGDEARWTEGPYDFGYVSDSFDLEIRDSRSSRRWTLRLDP